MRALAVMNRRPQNAPMPELQLGVAKLRLRQLGTATAKFEMTAGFTEMENAIRITFDYSADLYDESSIIRLLRHFIFLLEGLAGDLDRPDTNVTQDLTEQRSRDLVHAALGTEEVPVVIENDRARCDDRICRRTVITEPVFRIAAARIGPEDSVRVHMPHAAVPRIGDVEVVP